MAEPVPPEAEREPHFIGWLPMPRAYSRFLIPVVAGLVVVAAVTAAFLAQNQSSPGDGRWDHGQPTTFEGVVYAEPYAMIRVPGGHPGDPSATLVLVEEGKIGAKDRVRSFDGRPVRVTGTLLTREGWRMLELTAGEDGLRPAELPEYELASLRRSPPRPLGRVTLRGEIVDSKCYLGAMKPGEGFTHLGCAVLCLKGGIPPLLVVRNQPGNLYLLANAKGEALGSEYFSSVGKTIGLKGELVDWDDVRVFQVAGIAQ